LENIFALKIAAHARQGKGYVEWGLRSGIPKTGPVTQVPIGVEITLPIRYLQLDGGLWRVILPNLPVSWNSNFERE
jgi:hypothetical protein